MSIAQRLSNRRVELGFRSQRKFAKSIGIPFHTIQCLESGKQRHTRYMPEIAHALKTTVDFLMSGVINSQASTLIKSKNDSSLEIYRFDKEAVPLVPVIEWNEATTWRGFDMRQEFLKRYEMVPLLAGFSTKAYALKIKNDSMTCHSPGAESFKQGDIIIIDPDAKPKIGNFVIAFASRSEESIFRKLVSIGGESFLLPLNPIYQTQKVDESVRIIGVLYGSYRQHI